MSNFFDDLGKVVDCVVSSVSTEIDVAAQEQRLREAYQALGRMHYEAVRAGKTPDGPKFREQMKKIEDLIASIREARENQNVADV